MVVLLNHLVNKQRKKILLPLYEVEKPTFTVVKQNDRDYLEIPKDYFDSAMKQYESAQILAHIWFASERCGEKDIRNLVPKLPWQEDVDDYKLRHNIEKAKAHGLNVPEVVFDGGRD